MLPEKDENAKYKLVNTAIAEILKVYSPSGDSEWEKKTFFFPPRKFSNIWSFIFIFCLPFFYFV